MLEETLEWRSTFKPEEILWVSSIHLVQSSRFPACHRTRSSTTVAFYLLQHEVAAEGATGKRLTEQTSMTAKEEQSLWWDQQNRFNCSTYSSSCLGFYLVLAVKNRVLILFGLQNTSSHDNQLRHLVDLLEKCCWAARTNDVADGLHCLVTGQLIEFSRKAYIWFITECSVLLCRPLNISWIPMPSKRWDSCIQGTIGAWSLCTSTLISRYYYQWNLVERTKSSMTMRSSPDRSRW